jgi:primosomal protein N' (replication factor Y) (superfamily II helicase)
MSRITLFADVIVPLSVPNLYTYRIPADWNELAIPGKRVIIQFGKTKFYTGIIRHVHEVPPKKYEAKYLDGIIDDEPVVNDIQLKLWDWMAHYYICYPGEVMNAALPSGLKLSSETKVMLNAEIELPDLSEFSEKEILVIDALQDAQVLTLDQVASLLEVKNPQPVLKKLTAKGIVQNFEELKNKYKPRLVSYLRLKKELKENEAKLKEVLDLLEKRAYKQMEALMFYLSEEFKNKSVPLPEEQKGWMKKSELAKKFDASAVNALVKKEIFDVLEIETGRLEYLGKSGTIKALSEPQKKAKEEVDRIFEEKNVCLLHGITGSGKTEIYLHLIKEALERGQQVLYLVPEIALTTQLIYRIQHCFGDRAGVYHSKFSESERVEIWNGILADNKKEIAFNQHKYDVVIGARSSLFLPYKNLGLIIIDEEHDASFKQQDPAPRYNARDSAIYLATLHKAKVLMGSATPAIDSYYLAQTGKFGLVNLTQRFGEASLPEIVIADVKAENKANKSNSIFSSLLTGNIQLALSKKEQVILFQNRRGFAPMTECRTCGWIPQCVQCDVSLIYHKHSGKLTCHYCGYTVSPPSTCAACGGNDLRYKSYGTEKIEEEIEIIFPDAKIERMDLDSTRSKFSYAQIIEDFEEGNIDILVGTQMVTKGLDFDRVSLVGVLNADQMLNYPDFRSFEKGFQILQQVSGRAGRKSIPGKVIIQTTQPNHEIISFLLRNDYIAFYKAQLTERKAFNYPPFFRLIEFTFIDRDINMVNNGADFFTKELKAIFRDKVLGPEFPIVSKIRNQFHKKTLLKVEREFSPQKVREEINRIIHEFKTHEIFKKMRVMVNVDPL